MFATKALIAVFVLTSAAATAQAMSKLPKAKDLASAEPSLAKDVANGVKNGIDVYGKGGALDQANAAAKELSEAEDRARAERAQERASNRRN